MFCWSAKSLGATEVTPTSRPYKSVDHSPEIAYSRTRYFFRRIAARKLVMDDSATPHQTSDVCWKANIES